MIYRKSKHEWLDEVRLHATPRTKASCRMEVGELALAITVKSMAREKLKGSARSHIARVNAEDLASDSGIPHRTVRRYLMAFESWGFLAIERSRGGAKKHVITLLDPATAAVDRQWSKAKKEVPNPATIDGRVETEDNPATMDGRDTRPVHAGARLETLTLAGAGEGRSPTRRASVEVIEESIPCSVEHDEAARDAALMAARARVAEPSFDVAAAAPELVDASGRERRTAAPSRSASSYAIETEDLLNWLLGELDDLVAEYETDEGHDLDRLPCSVLEILEDATARSIPNLEIALDHFRRFRVGERVDLSSAARGEAQ